MAIPTRQAGCCLDDRITSLKLAQAYSRDSTRCKVGLVKSYEELIQLTSLATRVLHLCLHLRMSSYGWPAKTTKL